MEESGFYKVVGFILAILFAVVIGLCVFALLYTDFAQSGGIINDRERTTLRIAASAGAIAAILTWLLQSFAAHRSFATRFFYGLIVFVLVFSALGGLFELVHAMVTSPTPVDLSLSGIYFASLSAFYAFAISLVGSSIPAFIGLVLAAGLILAAVGPRRVY
ncbi:MAG: hypothetical protein D6773_18800 [Alphaproteobacteria bacterium]|nr:MAG: hypothetical protein D6773_18800 [Alphaproteobacteria bacterium]